MFYETMAGDTIERTAKEMVAYAHKLNQSVSTDFNGINLVAWPRCNSAENICVCYWSETNRRHERYINSPEYKEKCLQAEEAQKIRDALLKGALAVSPEKMTLRDEDGWQKTVAANTDGYGGAVIRYAELWARLMEGRISTGDTVEGCAEAASRIADNEGITGFMYGCAVSILSQVWIHGEDLRRWHNIKTQIKNEGENANESGGVLNPALLCITP
jgi:hypothetical protein